MEKIGMTADILQDILSDIGIEIRYNEMSHKEQIFDRDGVLNDTEKPLEILTAYICDNYREEYRYCTKTQVEQTLDLIASKHPYNPILEDITRCARQGVDGDFIGEISHDIMCISASDELSHILVKRWFLQSVALLQNRNDAPFGGDGMLILNGRQGVGKSLFTQAAAIEQQYYRSISINAFQDEADILAKANGVYIGEFAEIERSIKAGTMELFKSFVTASKDSYRPKYGRAINDYARRSSYIGTCNTSDFLIDQSGNRRFWVIPCEQKFDIDRLARCVNGDDDIFVMAYAQAYKDLQKNGLQSFRLTDAEREAVEQRNGGYMHKSDLEKILIAILQECGLKQFSIDELKVNDELAPFTNAQIGRMLSKLEFPQHTRKITAGGKPTTQRVYSNYFLSVKDA